MDEQLTGMTDYEILRQKTLNQAATAEAFREAEAAKQEKAREEAAQRAAQQEEEKYTDSVNTGEKVGPVLEAPPNEAKSQAESEVNDPNIRNIERYSPDPLMTLAAKGTYDTLKNAIGLVPWLGKPTQDALPSIPREGDEAQDFVRDLGGVLMPMMAGNWAVGSFSKAVNSRVMLGNTTNYIGNTAAKLGVDVGVTYTARSSGTDDNLARLFSDLTGVELPWATNENDTGPVRRLKHVIDGAGFFGLGEVLGTIGLIKNGSTARGIDDLSQEAVTKSTPKINTDNPLQSANDVVAGQRNVAVKAETIRRMEAGPGGVGPYGEVTSGDLRAIDNVPGMAVQKHDPFIHKYTEPHETFISNTDANPIQAKMEIGERQMNPKYRRSASSETPAFTEHVEKDLLNITGSGFRKDRLTESFTPISKAIETVRDNKIVRSSAENNKAINDLAGEIFDLDVEELTGNVMGMRNNVYTIGNMKIPYVDDQSFIQLGNAYKEVFETMYNPNHIRTSAVIAHGALEGATEIASSINMIPGKNTGNLQVKMMEKLQVVAQEMRLSQFIWGSSGNYKQLVQKLNGGKFGLRGKRKFTANEKNQMMADWFKNEKTKFDDFLNSNSKESKDMVKVWKDIAEKRPEMLKPFSELVMLTNGDVKTLEHLDKYIKKALGPKGTLKAAFLSDDKVPNLFIEGLINLRYNAMLGIGAIKNTFEGNSIAALMKPMTMTLGSLQMRDLGAAQKHLKTYGGFVESLRRGMRFAHDQYEFVLNNPGAAAINRPDLLQRDIDSWEFFKSMSDVWKENGDIGKLTLWNLSRSLHGFNSPALMRYGSIGMAPQDGFLKGMNLSAYTRAKAYDFALDRANYKDGETYKQAFRRANDEVYKHFFDKDGIVIQDNIPEEVNYVTREMALQGEDDVASMLSYINQKSPLFRAIMAFPTTTVNGIKLASTFNPLFGNPARQFSLGKIGKTLAAQTLEEKKAALALHGVTEYSEAAFNARKADYIGRQMIGNSLVIGGALWALDGNLTGAGPEDFKDKQRWEKLGYKPFHIKLPVIGWYDYRNKEPFTSLLSTIGDVAMQARRTDSGYTENQFKKISTLFLSGPTSKDLLRPFNSLLKLWSGDEREAQRFIAYTAASFVPHKATMTWINNTFLPGLKEIREEGQHYLATNFKFMDPGDHYLVDVIDPFTKEPVDYEDFQTSLINNSLPFLQSNSGTEPWRMFLIRSGWQGVKDQQVNPYTQSELHPEERFFINNYVADNAQMKEKVEELMDENTRNGKIYWKSLRSYEASFDPTKPPEQRAAPKNMEHVKMLDYMSKKGFNEAFAALRAKYTEFHEIGSLRQEAKAAEERGDASKAAELRTEAAEKDEVYTKKLKADYKKDKFGF